MLSPALCMSSPKPWAVRQPTPMIARKAVTTSRTMIRLNVVIIWLDCSCVFANRPSTKWAAPFKRPKVLPGSHFTADSYPEISCKLPGFSSDRHAICQKSPAATPDIHNASNGHTLRRGKPGGTSTQEKGHGSSNDQQLEPLTWAGAY